MSIRPGDVFAQYRIGEPLGKGGMGEVFVAEDLELGRRVAVKTLASEFRDDPAPIRDGRATAER